MGNEIQPREEIWGQRDMGSGLAIQHFVPRGGPARLSRVQPRIRRWPHPLPSFDALQTETRQAQSHRMPLFPFEMFFSGTGQR